MFEKFTDILRSVIEFHFELKDLRMDILKTYRLFRQMNQYPNLMGLMRSIFMDVLEQKGIITREKLHQRAQEELRADGLPDTEANRQEYVESLIDYYFANHLSPSEIENYINLARKKDMGQTLSMVVNRDQATAHGDLSRPFGSSVTSLRERFSSPGRRRKGSGSP